MIRDATLATNAVSVEGRSEGFPLRCQSCYHRTLTGIDGE